jgi:copper chaperone CopZ
MITKQLELRVGNLDCEHDANAIERGLEGFNGLVNLKVYFKSAKVAITYDPAATEPKILKEKLESRCFTPQKRMEIADQPKP